MGGICILIHKSRESVAESGSVKNMISAVLPNAGGTSVSAQWKNIAVGAYDTLGMDMGRCLFESDQLLVVCDAEFYNGREFAHPQNQNLVEASFVAHLYHKKGLDWWKDLRGVWSVFIWDKQAEKGWAFRDRVGVKPLVYFENSSEIVIATRIKSIATLPNFKKVIDPQAIHSYLNMEMIPSPMTIFKGIQKLESGHRLNVSIQSVSTTMVWNMSYPSEKITDEAEIKSRIREELKNSVQLQANYREPLSEVGAFLSGGLDSSSIVGLFEESFPGETKTFSMGFDEAGFDEMEYCRIAAKAFKTAQNEYYVTPEDILNGFPKIIDAYDEPFANSSAIPSYFCARLAHEKGMKVLLGGDGGDEIFGGNSRYKEVMNQSQRFPTWLQKGVLEPAMMLTPEFLKVGPVRGLDRYLKHSKAELHEKIHGFGLERYLDRGKVFTSEFLAKGKILSSAEISHRHLLNSDADNDIDRYMYHDLKITLMDNDLPKVNTMTELAGIRVRYPFLDVNLMEMSGRIPMNMKVRGNRLRYVYKEAMRGLLPNEILEKTKHGFGIPVAKWMVRPGKLNDLVRDVIFDPRTEARGIFKKSFLENIYKLSSQDNTTFYGTHLYYVFFLEMWMRNHVDGK